MWEWVGAELGKLSSRNEGERILFYDLGRILTRLGGVAVAVKIINI